MKPVVLFDWGETLMWIPGMVHDPDRHLACVEAIFQAECQPHIDRCGGDLSCEAFIAHYLEACRIQIARSKETQREHTFAARFEMAFGLASLKVPAVLSGHTHGGQIVLPGVGALARRSFPVLSGLGTQGGTSIFVSRGVGTIYVPVRINCPPEVALLTLRRPART